MKPLQSDGTKRAFSAARKSFGVVLSGLIGPGQRDPPFLFLGEEMECAIGSLPCRAGYASTAEDNLRPAVGKKMGNCGLDGMR